MEKTKNKTNNYSLMKKLFTLLMFCSMAFLAFADKQISGVVVDEKGEPLVGASVQAEGVGTITGYDGDFALTVPDATKTVLVKYMGMEDQVVPVKKVMHIVMKENSVMIQEVVATGYGNVAKGGYTGSVTTVDAETIEKKSPSEISKALAGEVAGVQVVNTSGQPGTNATIRVRGIGSIYSGSAPLYVVDGIPYDGDISAIDPGDIASTTVLKDATATSLYGSRGANGVILITTKKGTSGEEGKIDVDVKYGANMHLLPLYSVVTDPKEYIEMGWMGIYNNLKGAYSSDNRRIQAANDQLYSAKGLPAIYNLWNVQGNELINGYTGKFNDDVQYKPGMDKMTSWSDAIFHVGQKLDATARISGGSEKTTYFTSFGYLRDEGYYIGSDYDRLTVRANVDHQAKKWLKGNLNMAYSYSTMNAVGQGDNMNNGFNYVNSIPAIFPVYEYNEDGSIKTDPKTGGYMYDYGMHEGGGRAFGAGINPAGALRYDRDNTVQHQLATSGSLEFKFGQKPFLKDLKFMVNAGAQYVSLLNSEYTNSFYGDAAGIGRVSKTQQNYLSFMANELLEYNKLIDEHTIRVLAGHETLFTKSSVMYGSKNYVADTNGEAVLELGNAVQMSGVESYTNSYALDSYLATASYVYNEKYGLNGSYRADGSSRFAKGHRWGHFGSVGAMWMFTDEGFIKNNVSWLKNGKLRLSWGVLGNQDISSYVYSDRYAVDNVDGQVAYIWSGKGNEDLTWERSQQVDLGLELDFDKYVSMELDYYYKHTDHMLMPRYVAPSFGYSYFYINGGSMRNQGVELQLNVHAVKERNVQLDIRFNGSHYANKVLSLPTDIETGSEMIQNGALAVGHSPYDWQMVEYVGVNPEDGQAQYLAYYDADLGSFGTAYSADVLQASGRTGNNYIIDVFKYRETHKTANIQTEIVSGRESAYAGADYIGKSAIADFAGGFGFNLNVYGVTLDVTCSYGLGGYGYDNTYAALMNSDKIGSSNWHIDMRNAWNDLMTDEQKANATVPRLSNGADTYANMASTRFLTSNTFLSLNNIRLGYSFPKKLIDNIKLKTLSLYLSADNLAVASARKGYNPMSSFTGTSDSYQYTPLSTIMGGIKFQF